MIKKKLVLWMKILNRKIKDQPKKILLRKNQRKNQEL